MNKKDYKAIANAINYEYNYCEDEDTRESIIAIVDNLIGYFESENERFDEDKFKAACLALIVEEDNV